MGAARVTNQTDNPKATTVARNVLWNWSGIGVQMAIGVVVAPFLIRRLGDEGYGIWILVGSLTSYFGLLELGLRASMGRHIAFHRAQHDSAGVNAILNTAIAAECVTAIVIAALTAAGAILFPRFFDVSPTHLHEARIALLLVGLNLAFTLPLAIFDSVLWAFQRFDLINLIDIPIGVARMAALFYFLPRGHGLIAVAVIAILSTTLGALLKMILSLRVEPTLRLSFASIHAAAARQLYSFGVWSFLLSMARRTRGYFSPLLIGALISVEVVTLYSIASRLIGYAIQIVVATTGVLTPVATVLHAQAKKEEQERLFLEGGKYCSAVALFFLLAFAFLGHSFITLWIGPKQAHAAILLNILSVGEVLPMSQWVTYSMILAMARHRLSALVALVEVVLMIALMLILVRPMGMTGVCIGIAIAGTGCRGIFQVIYGCRLMGVTLQTYFAQAFLRPLLLAAASAIAMAALHPWSAPETWRTLIAYATIFTVLYFGLALVVLGGLARLRLSRARLASSAAAQAP